MQGFKPSSGTNKKGDQKLLHYICQEKIWDKEPDMRQIIVRVLDKKWNVQIELSIVTDDKDRDAKEIITLMLSRWVQENDFKYMIKHFGLNQITSYAFTDYRALRDKIEDKIYICFRHKALTKEMVKVRAKFKTALLDKHNFDQKHGEMAQEKLPKKEQERKIKIDAKINGLYEALEKLKKERSETPNSFPNLTSSLIRTSSNSTQTPKVSWMQSRCLPEICFICRFIPSRKNTIITGMTMSCSGI